jgi:hypothetical protein
MPFQLAHHSGYQTLFPVTIRTLKPCTCLPSYPLVHLIPVTTLFQTTFRYKDHIWLGHSPFLQTKVIAALHNSAMGGIQGFQLHSVE